MFRNSKRQTLVMALLLIAAGISLVNPFAVEAESNLVYLYPIPQNNPVEQSGLFWFEDHPEWGTFTLPEWSEVIRNKQIVVGIPAMTLGASMAGDKLGKHIAYKISNWGKGKKEPTTENTKDVFFYDRTITRESITEKVRVEIGNHFSDPATFERFMEVINNGLTDPEELKKIPEAPPKGTNQAGNLFGNTLIMGGAALLLRLLSLAL